MYAYSVVSDSAFFYLKQIGPNASISANARIGAGVRLVNCIILDDVEIKVLTKHSNFSDKVCIFEYINSSILSLLGKRGGDSCDRWMEIFDRKVVKSPGMSKNLFNIFNSNKQPRSAVTFNIYLF